MDGPTYYPLCACRIQHMNRDVGLCHIYDMRHLHIDIDHNEGLALSTYMRHLHIDINHNHFHIDIYHHKISHTRIGEDAQDAGHYLPREAFRGHSPCVGNVRT